jgi:hypothetical protein
VSPTKIATGQEILAAAIAWRNLFYAAADIKAPYAAVDSAWSAEQEAYEVFVDLLDTRREIVK